jgi:hypothetical protein
MYVCVCVCVSIYSLVCVADIGAQTYWLQVHIHIRPSIHADFTLYTHIHIYCTILSCHDRGVHTDTCTRDHTNINILLFCNNYSTHVHKNKADCVWVGRKILEAKGKSRSNTFVQRGKRNFQTAQNGVFPSVAIFAGQLKRNQLYIHMGPYKHKYTSFLQ